MALYRCGFVEMEIDISVELLNIQIFLIYPVFQSVRSVKTLHNLQAGDDMEVMLFTHTHTHTHTQSGQTGCVENGQTL